MSRLLRGATAMVALCLGGCALLTGGAHPPALPLLPPAAFGTSRSASQSLDLAFREREIALQSAVSVDARTLTLVALGPFGQRAFTLRYDGVQLQSEAAAGGGLPEGLDGARVLADLELALALLPAWQQALKGSDWQLDEPQPGLRRLRWQGRLVSEVHIAEPRDPWSSRLWLSNYVDGYALAITPQAP